MWPMLAGIGPVPGEGDHLGEFFNTDGHSVWKYRDGVASEVADNGKEDRYPPVAGAPYKMASAPKWRFRSTVGRERSGEATAIAFRGRPKTRSSESTPKELPPPMKYSSFPVAQPCG